MENDRFAKKRNSLVGGGLAKFEGAEAADQFARRQSSYTSRVRQSIPDIRFDEHGVPISTRQLQARAGAGSSGSLPRTGRRLSEQPRGPPGGSLHPPGKDGRLSQRRLSEQPRSLRSAAAANLSVRSLSRKFSPDDDDASETKANFTLPTNTRTGMFGTNRRWSVKPEWMKKPRRSSVKEEFIERNLSSTTSGQEPEMTSVSEEMAAATAGVDAVDNGEVSSTSESSSEDTDSSDSDAAPEHSSEEATVAKQDENTKEQPGKEETNGAQVNGHSPTQEESREMTPTMKVSNKEEKKEKKKGEGNTPNKNGRQRRKKRKGKLERVNSGSPDPMPPRPPPPPLPVQMCLVEPESSSSDEECDEVIITQYGKQRIFVSKLYHVFETTNGPLKSDRA